MFSSPARGVWPLRHSHRGAAFPRLWDGLQACYAPLVGTTGATVEEVTGREGTPTTQNGVTQEPNAIFIDNTTSSGYRLELPDTWIVPNVTGQMSIVLDVEINSGGDSDGRIITKQSTWSGAAADTDWMLSLTTGGDVRHVRTRINAGGVVNTSVSTAAAYNFGDRSIMAVVYDDPNQKLWVLNSGGLNLPIDSDHPVGGDISNRSGSSLVPSFGAGQSSVGVWNSETNMRLYAAYFYNRAVGPEDIVSLSRMDLFRNEFTERMAFYSFAPVGGGETHEAAVTMAGSAGAALAAAAQYEPALSFGGTAGDTMAAAAQYLSSLSLGGTAAEALSAAAQYEAALSMGGTAGEAIAADVSLESALAMGATAGASLSAAVQFVASLSVSAVADITWAPDAFFEAVTTFAGQAGMSIVGGLVHEESTTIAAAGGLALSGNISLEGLVSFAVSAGQASTVSAVLEPALPLSAIAGQSQATTAVLEPSMALAVTAAIDMLAGAVTEAGLSLDAVSDISFAGAVLSATITTPDGRCHTVSIDMRTLTATDDRTHTAIH